MLTWDEFIGNLLIGWAMPGVEMARARLRLLCGTVGTFTSMLREKAKRNNARPRVPMRCGGADRPVVALTVP